MTEEVRNLALEWNRLNTEQMGKFGVSKTWERMREIQNQIIELTKDYSDIERLDVVRLAFSEVTK